MQMPVQPPAERQRGQQRSSLMGEKCRVSVTFRKVKSRCRSNGERLQTSEQQSGLCKHTHTHEMFHVARTDYKLLGLTRIHLFIEYSVVFLIAIQRDYSIPSLWLCMVLNGLHAFLNRKPRRNNRYQVTTGIQSHSELQERHAICLEYNTFIITFITLTFSPVTEHNASHKVHGITELNLETVLTFILQEQGSSRRI